MEENIVEKTEKLATDAMRKAREQTIIEWLIVRAIDTLIAENEKETETSASTVLLNVLSQMSDWFLIETAKILAHEQAEKKKKAAEARELDRKIEEFALFTLRQKGVSRVSEWLILKAVQQIAFEQAEGERIEACNKAAAELAERLQLEAEKKAALDEARRVRIEAEERVAA